MHDLTTNATCALDCIAQAIATGNNTNRNETVRPGHRLLCDARRSYNNPAMQYLVNKVQELTGHSLRFFTLNDVPGRAAKAGMCAAFVVVPADAPLTVLTQEAHADLIIAYVVVATYSVSVQPR